MIAGATPLQRAFLPGWYGPDNAGAFMLSILSAIQFFLVGLLVADLYVDGWARIPQTWRWDVACIPLWILMFWLEPHAFRFLAPIILPIVFVGAFKGSVMPRILRNPAITTVGGMCYSIYLTHRTTVFVLQATAGTFSSTFLDLAGGFPGPGRSRFDCCRRRLLPVDRTPMHGPSVASEVDGVVPLRSSQ